MTLKREESEKAYREAVELMPAGVNSPVRAFRSVGGTPLFVKEASGSRFTDIDGNSFLDFSMSWGPLILGHGDKKIIDAITEAAMKGTSYGMPHQGEIDLARQVIDSVPSIEMVRFVNSGTEATMSALRLARGYTGRDKIVKFDGCYHGHADHLLVAAGSGLATFSMPDSAGVTKNNASDTLVAPFNDIDFLQELFTKEGKEIAALIIEPVPCNFGCIVPDKSYLQEVRELCSLHGVLLIFDEVITGFRLAAGGAQEYFGVMPDITCLGKVIGGGLPVGAYGASREIMNHIAPLGPVYQAGTLSGNPLAMAAGKVMVEECTSEGFYRKLEDKMERFHDGLKDVLEEYGDRVQFISIGSIFSFLFTSTKEIKTHDDVRTADSEKYKLFHSELLKKKIYLAPSGFEVGFFSTAHSNEDIDEAAKGISEAIKTILEK